MIRDDFESFSVIPVKTRKRKRISGHYRRELAHSFDVHLYHRRNLVETVFSVLKRRFGECLKSRKYRNQVKEIKIKLILHNISRIPFCFSVFVIVEDSTVPLFRLYPRKCVNGTAIT